MPKVLGRPHLESAVRELLDCGWVSSVHSEIRKITVRDAENSRGNEFVDFFEKYRTAERISWTAWKLSIPAAVIRQFRTIENEFSIQIHNGHLNSHRIWFDRRSRPAPRVFLNAAFTACTRSPMLRNNDLQAFRGYFGLPRLPAVTEFLYPELAGMIDHDRNSSRRAVGVDGFLYRSLRSEDWGKSVYRCMSFWGAIRNKDGMRICIRSTYR